MNGTALAPRGRSLALTRMGMLKRARVTRLALALGAALCAGPIPVSPARAAAPPAPSGPAAPSGPTAAVVPVRVTDAWIRALPGDLPAAGYATVTNLGDAPLALTGASSPDFGAVMFHRSAANQGMERMLPVDSLPLGPHATVSFAPGGYHIMLMQAQHPLAPGDHVALTLRFSGGGSIVVPFEVRGADGRP